MKGSLLAKEPRVPPRVRRPRAREIQDVDEYDLRRTVKIMHGETNEETFAFRVIDN